MKFSPRFASFFWLAIVLWACLGGPRSAQATVNFIVSPTSLNNAYNGDILLGVTGLTNAETVRIQKYLDINSNGIIDGGDLLVQDFTVTDGTNWVIGGVTNFNVPGDLNTATGEITSKLVFQNGDFVQNIIGSYLYKLTSPVNHFSPITNRLTVTNFAYAQKITGTVYSNGTSMAVADAVVLLFPPPAAGQNGPGTPIAGAVANSSGMYSIQVPPGNYVPLAVSSNYVANYGASPLVSLASGQTINTNISLTNATMTISGQVLDADSPTQGIGGIFLPLNSSANGQAFIAVGFSGTNGYFTNGVTAGQWNVGGDDSGLIIHGLVGPQNSMKVSAGRTGVTLAYPKATAFFYGRVTDGSGNPMANIDVGSADYNSGLYQADAYTDTNGDYVLGVVGGLGSGDPWSVSYNGNGSAYVFSQPLFNQNGGTNISAGQAVLVNITGLLATNIITGNVQFNGTNLVGAGVGATATINGFTYNLNLSDTDENGNYSLAVPNGTWSVFVSCQGGSDSLDNLLGSGNYECPENQNVTIAGNNGTANFSIQPCAGPQIYTTSVPGGQVGSYYDVQLQGSTCSDNDIWTIVSGSLPDTFTFNSDGEFFGTPDTAGTYDFSVELSDGNGHSITQALSLTITGSSLVITNATLANGIVGIAYNQSLGVTGGQSPYTWQLAAGSANPPAGLTVFPSGVISGTPTTNQTVSFNVQVSDQNNSTATKTFSITVNPLPVLGRPSWLTNQFELWLRGASNQNYTVQVTTNLASPNWFSLYTTNSATTNSFLILDPSATNSARFYRILIGP